jgi:hypothetical protein
MTIAEYETAVASIQREGIPLRIPRSEQCFIDCGKGSRAAQFGDLERGKSLVYRLILLLPTPIAILVDGGFSKVIDPVRWLPCPRILQRLNRC